MITRTYWHESDDLAPLFVYEWAPESKPIGIVHISHGLAEHAGRYAHVAEALTGRGYAVYANDHRGHGKSAPTRDDLGLFAFNDGWNRVLRDLRLLVDGEREKHPALPMFLLGHSMGSFLVQQFLYRHGGLLAGAVLSGSNGKPDMTVYALRMLARAERVRLGRRGRSLLLHRLSLHVANRGFQPIRTDFDWLSSDRNEVDKFAADPLCGFVSTTQLWNELLDATIEIAQSARQSPIPKDLPVYIFSGARDPVGDNGKGIERLLAAYRRAGLRNVRHKIYPEGRHEMFNEIRRDEVIGDLLAWLDGNVTSKPPRTRDLAK